MPQTQTTTSPPAAGAGSPAEAAAVAVAADATETERLVKLITAMGYPESEARLSLARSSNNVQKAVQLLVEGENDDDDGEARQRRRSRRSLKKLRSTLLGDPCVTEDAIVQLMREQSNARALAEMFSGSGVQAMQLLLAEEDSEADGVEEQLGVTLDGEGEGEGEEEDSSYLEEPSTASTAESSPPSN